MMDPHDFLAACHGPIAPPQDGTAGDVFAVQQLARTYALGIDQRDEALVRSVFAGDASVQGMIGSSPVDEYVPRLIAGVKPYVATMHNITNQYTSLDGDRGTVWSYCVAIHIEPDESDRDDLIVGVTYRDQVERRDGRWSIVERHTAPGWVRGPLPTVE